MKKVNPYSIEGVHQSLYYHFVQEWKGLSKVKNKNNNLGFSDLLKHIIQLSYDVSDNMFEQGVLRYSERLKKDRVLRLSEYNAKSKETKFINDFNENLKSIREKQNQFNLHEFRNKIKESINDNYSYLDALEPKQLRNINDDNLVQQLSHIKQTKKERIDGFRGLPYKMKDHFHFIDYISAPICYYRIQNNRETALDVFLDSVISYSIRINEVDNTKKIINQLNEIDQFGLEIKHYEMLIKDTVSKERTKPNNHNAEINKFLSKNKKNQA